MRQLCALNPPEHAAIDGVRIRRVYGIALVLVDPGAADSGIDDEDGHFLAFNQLFGQFHAPPAQFRLLALWLSQTG